VINGTRAETALSAESMKHMWRFEGLDSRLPRRSGVAFGELAEFSFRDGKFRCATIQTDLKLRKYPHHGLVNVFQSDEMDTHFRGKLALVYRPARLARHSPSRLETGAQERDMLARLL
jgi:hypothetical protein